jgi:hypothetical protein
LVIKQARTLEGGGLTIHTTQAIQKRNRDGATIIQNADMKTLERMKED